MCGIIYYVGIHAFHDIRKYIKYENKEGRERKIIKRSWRIDEQTNLRNQN